MQKDIYTVEPQEGFYLANEFEKMRVSKDRGNVVVVCKGSGSEPLKALRKSYLLGANIGNIFREAENYYLIMENNGIALILVYPDYYVQYALQIKTDWRVVELELIDKNMMDEPQFNHHHPVGRTESETIHLIANFAFRYGFSKVFTVDDEDFLIRLFYEVMKMGFDKNEFGLAVSITEFVLQHGMRPAFKKMYMTD